MSGTGPVEPANSTETGGSHEVIGADAPRLADRLAERWHTLSPRARNATIAAGLLSVAMAAVVALQQAVTPDHRTAAPEPAPWPANVTAWRYVGLAAPLDPRATSGVFRFTVSVDRGPAVTLQVIGADFDGLTARATPYPFLTVHAGTPRRIAVRISVSDCSGLPLNADLPFLDVTLRNTRAIQHHSFIFGEAYSRDLSELLHAACDRLNAGQGPRPTGSASSQNADDGEIPPNRPRSASGEVSRPSRHNKKVTSQPTPLTLPAHRA